MTCLQEYECADCAVYNTTMNVTEKIRDAAIFVTKWPHGLNSIAIDNPKVDCQLCQSPSICACGNRQTLRE